MMMVGVTMSSMAVRAALSVPPLPALPAATAAEVNRTGVSSGKAASIAAWFSGAMAVEVPIRPMMALDLVLIVRVPVVDR
jgi:hypothetical protein